VIRKLKKKRNIKSGKLKSFWEELRDFYRQQGVAIHRQIASVMNFFIGDIEH